MWHFDEYNKLLGCVHFLSQFYVINKASLRKKIKRVAINTKKEMKRENFISSYTEKCTRAIAKQTKPKQRRVKWMSDWLNETVCVCMLRVKLSQQESFCATRNPIKNYNQFTQSEYFHSVCDKMFSIRTAITFSLIIFIYENYKLIASLWLNL